MTTQSNDWRDLFASGGLAVTIFIGGVALQSIEVFIGSSMLPTVVADIGGIELFAWNTTLFVVASILASVFAAVRPASIGPRAAYLIAAATFGLGSLICGLAPDIAVLLIGRTVQGFGAGLLVVMTTTMLRLIFPERLWPRAMALNSLVWGVSTLLGPAIGGIFAEFGAWRWAFLAIVPLAALLALGAMRILPARTERNISPVPILQIVLVSGIVLMVSVASIVANPMTAGSLLLAALGAAILLGIVENRSSAPLLPAGTFSFASPFAALFATILLLGVAITSDIFAPLFLQRLHGLSPLWAGYTAALVAAGWTVSAFRSAGWGESEIRRAILASPIILTLATAVMIVSLGIGTGGWPLLIVSSIALFALGVGIGMAFQHLSRAVLSTGSAADNDRVSAGLSLAQLFASGLGAAIGGVVVNAAGLPGADSVGEIENAARWLFLTFTVISALGIPFALMVVRDEAHPLAQPAE